MPVPALRAGLDSAPTLAPSPAGLVALPTCLAAIRPPYRRCDGARSCAAGANGAGALELRRAPCHSAVVTASALPDCLVGYTGFVGNALMHQHHFACLFNSRNIGAIGGQAYGLVVCAAAPGSMLEANSLPERDAQRIDDLIAQLRTVRARQFVLISTIAVLARFDGGDDEGATAFQEELAYGRNRRRLEQFCEEQFERCLIVRLPALYGPGLRKNFIFDLCNPVPTMMHASRLQALLAALPAGLADLAAGLYAPDPATGMYRIDRARLQASPAADQLAEAVEAHGFSAVGFHNPETTYQFYGISDLKADIDRALAAGLALIHLVTEPVAAAFVHRSLLGRDMPANTARLHREDVRTRHAELWGQSGPYLADRERVMDRLREFVARQRAGP